MNELVKNENGKLVTNSILVARKFDKQHRNVVQTIRNILAAENSAVKEMFAESVYYNEKNQPYPVFIMNRDGFSLLAMGFTGEKALKFKVDFINAFNEMENEIHGKSMIQPRSSLELLKLSIKAIEEQQLQIDDIDKRVNMIEARTKTDPEYFTIIGYATINKMQLNLNMAAKIGRMAAKLCNDTGIIMGDIPDPRFGKVRTYPRKILDQVFSTPL